MDWGYDDSRKAHGQRYVPTALDLSSEIPHTGRAPSKRAVTFKTKQRGGNIKAKEGNIGHPFVAFQERVCSGGQTRNTKLYGLMKNQASAEECQCGRLTDKPEPAAARERKVASYFKYKHGDETMILPHR